ncbi:MAG: YqaE/Pmp3 family membrane protein [Chloroflexi bacterium]|nr:YqaE/Pmp3 family membrane protein [Chloroflexota bacterium]
MDNKVVKIILAIFIPPLAIYLHEGNKVTKNFWIDLALWILLFGIGGIIYALYIILK